MKKENPVVWFEIYTDDLQRARRFYEQVLDIEFSPLGNPEAEQLQMLAFPADMESKNRASGALVHAPGMPAGHNSTLVYFISTDCSIEAGRVEAAGGTLVRPKMAIGQYGFVALAKDTEGNMFGIHSMQ